MIGSTEQTRRFLGDEKWTIKKGFANSYLKRNRISFALQRAIAHMVLYYLKWQKPSSFRSRNIEMIRLLLLDATTMITVTESGQVEEGPWKNFSKWMNFSYYQQSHLSLCFNIFNLNMMGNSLFQILTQISTLNFLCNSGRRRLVF